MQPPPLASIRQQQRMEALVWEMAAQPGTDSASAARALALQRSELLAALPLPFSLQLVDAQGQVVKDDRLLGANSYIVKPVEFKKFMDVSESI